MTRRMENILQEIGYLMAQTVGGNPDGAFLYAEVEPGAISWGLFIDRGEYVDYFYDDDGIDSGLFDLWHAAEPGKQWSGVSYAIVEGSLDVQFYYHDGWEEDEIYAHRRKRILAERYGDKPIKYPPPPLTATRL